MFELLKKYFRTSIGKDYVIRAKNNIFQFFDSGILYVPRPSPALNFVQTAVILSLVGETILEVSYRVYYIIQAIWSNLG